MYCAYGGQHNTVTKVRVFPEHTKHFFKKHINPLGNKRFTPNAPHLHFFEKKNERRASLYGIPFFVIVRRQEKLPRICKKNSVNPKNIRIFAS